MMWLRPEIREGLAYAVLHQAIALCGVASLWVSKEVSIFLGLFLWLADLPAFLAIVLLRDVAYVPWLSNWYVPDANAAPRVALTALRYHQSTVSAIFVAGALQWFLIGFIRIERLSRKSN